MKKVAAEALFEHHNQYPPMAGVPELRQAVARHSEAHQGLKVDWSTETLITVGATEGIAAVFMGILNPGDEVIIFDPMYDSYVGMCLQCGAVVKPVKLLLPDFSIPIEELRSAFNARTKMVVVNTPHNPTGKVFSREELQLIADLCIQHDVIALCDEVYEHLVWAPHEHLSLRCLPGMEDRAIRLGSAGKTFSFTAWKVGWMTGPARLLAPIQKAHQFLVFTVPSNLQLAVAHGLDQEQTFYRSLGPSLRAKRRYLEEGLLSCSVDILPAQGTYFLIADMSRHMREGETNDQLCQRLTEEAGVTLIPVSAFYYGSNPPQGLVRFCFCKDNSKLEEGCRRLRKYLGNGQDC